jgi:hypothetical protein
VAEVGAGKSPAWRTARTSGGGRGGRCCPRGRLSACQQQRLCLTCELGEALGVSAGDEKLGKKEARSSGGHGDVSGNNGAREGGTTLNRGGSVGGDDGVMLKMRPWYGRPRSARVRRAPQTDRRSVACPLPGTARTAVTRGREEFKAPRSAGAWGRHAARAACGRRRRGASAQAWRAGTCDVAARRRSGSTMCRCALV